MTSEVLRTQMAALKRQQRQARRQAMAARVRSVHRQWWWTGATIVGLTVGAVGCQRWQEQQTATTLALAQIATADRTPPTTVPVAVESMPNPLESMSLSAQARWVIGIDGTGKLLPTRSSGVVASMLTQLDPCALFVGLDDRAAVIVSRTPRPGFVPLVLCAATSTTTTSTTVKAAA